MTPDIIQKCSQCGSELILISEVTEQVEGSRFSQTIKEYRCSDERCQAEKDRQTARRIKLRDDKAEDAEKRLKEKQQIKRDKVLLSEKI